MAFWKTASSSQSNAVDSNSESLGEGVVSDSVSPMS